MVVSRASGTLRASRLKGSIFLLPTGGRATQLSAARRPQGGREEAAGRNNNQIIVSLFRGHAELFAGVKKMES